MKIKPRLYKGNGIWWCAFEGRAWYGSTWEQAFEGFVTYVNRYAKTDVPGYLKLSAQIRNTY